MSEPVSDPCESRIKKRLYVRVFASATGLLLAVGCGTQPAAVTLPAAPAETCAQATQEGFQATAEMGTPVSLEYLAGAIQQTAFEEAETSPPAAAPPVVVLVTPPANTAPQFVRQPASGARQAPSGRLAINPPTAVAAKSDVANYEVGKSLIVQPAAPIKDSADVRFRGGATTLSARQTQQANALKTAVSAAQPVNALPPTVVDSVSQRSVLVKQPVQQPVVAEHTAVDSVPAETAVEQGPLLASVPKLKLTAEGPPQSVIIPRQSSSIAVPIQQTVKATDVTAAPRVAAVPVPSGKVADSASPLPAVEHVAPTRPSVSMAVSPAKVVTGPKLRVGVPSAPDRVAVRPAAPVAAASAIAARVPADTVPPTPAPVKPSVATAPAPRIVFPPLPAQARTVVPKVVQAPMSRPQVAPQAAPNAPPLWSVVVVPTVKPDVPQIAENAASLLRPARLPEYGEAKPPVAKSPHYAAAKAPVPEAPAYTAEKPHVPQVSEYAAARPRAPQVLDYPPVNPRAAQSSNYAAAKPRQPQGTEYTATKPLPVKVPEYTPPRVIEHKPAPAIARAPAPAPVEIAQVTPTTPPPVRMAAPPSQLSATAALPLVPSGAQPAPLAKKLEPSTVPPSPLWTAPRQAAVVAENSPHVAQPQPAPPPVAVPLRNPRPRSSALVSVSQRVHQQVRYAFSLAGRGATHSARVELTDAMKLVAMALDADEGSTRHNEAMMAGLTAMREADDFAARDSQADVRIDVQRLVATHKTPVMKETVGPQTTPIEALQTYYSYARQQLAYAGGNEIGASMALYGMARIQMSIGDQQGMNGPKAITMHQAALAVDAQNYMAANELGVLLARYGQLSEAETMLRHSVAVSPQPETWRNLAEVHRRQGQVQLESEDRRRGDEQLAARRAGKVPNPVANGIVTWVDPNTFVALTDPAPGGMPVGEIAAAAAVAAPTTPAAASVSASQSKSWSLPESIRGLTSRINQPTKR